MKEVEFFKYLDIGKDEFYNLRHVHNESYEILLTLSGGGTFFIRDRLFNLYPNAIYFTNKAEPHYSVPETPQNYYRRKIIISADFVDELTQISSCTQLIDDLFRKKGGMCIIPNEETVDFVNKEFFFFSYHTPTATHPESSTPKNVSFFNNASIGFTISISVSKYIPPYSFKAFILK